MSDVEYDAYGDEKGEFKFARLKPLPTTCPWYGSGACCHDYHFDISTVLRDKPSMPACDSNEGRIAQQKSHVNCKACLEVIHS